MMGRMNMGQQIATAPASRRVVATPMKKGGMVKGYAKGGKAKKMDGCCMKGHTRAGMK
jgi:hypothetical protein